MNNLRRAISMMLREAFDEDKFGREKTSKPTKEKERVVIDVGDDLEQRGITRGQPTPSKSTTTTARPAKRKFRGARGSGPSLDAFRGSNVANTLSAAASSEYEGDFDADFEAASQLAAATMPDVESEYEPAPRRRVNPAGFGEPKPKPHTFQPNVPMRLDEPGLAKRSRRFENAKAAIAKVLMDEFVQPAMSLGQNLLPVVYGELGRLMRNNPDAFLRQFGAAINFLREMENEWFAELLGIQHIPRRMNPPEGAERDMHKAIINIMKKYYNAVLALVAENSDNLKAALDDIREDVGDEEFSRAFFEALSDTRDVEDEAFGQLMGGLKRLR